jgi:hypothetical protein
MPAPGWRWSRARWREDWPIGLTGSRRWRCRCWASVVGVAVETRRHRLDAARRIAPQVDDVAARGGLLGHGVVGVTHDGVQDFFCRGARRQSTAGRVILIEPGERHDTEHGAAGPVDRRAEMPVVGQRGAKAERPVAAAHPRRSGGGVARPSRRRGAAPGARRRSRPGRAGARLAAPRCRSSASVARKPRGPSRPPIRSRSQSCGR